MSDTLLLEKAKEWLSKHQIPDDNAECYRLAEFAAEQMPKWTYCKDALPTEDGEYFVSAPGLGGNLHTWTSELQTYRDNRREWNLFGIVAWMPLPEAAHKADAS